MLSWRPFSFTELPQPLPTLRVAGLLLACQSLGNPGIGVPWRKALCFQSQPRVMSLSLRVQKEGGQPWACHPLAPCAPGSPISRGWSCAKCCEPWSSVLNTSTGFTGVTQMGHSKATPNGHQLQVGRLVLKAWLLCFLLGQDLALPASGSHLGMLRLGWALRMQCSPRI